MRKLVAAALIGVSSLTAIASGTVLAAEFYTKRLTSVAIDGYDTVALLKGDLVEGSKKYETDYLGATFRFSSAANRDMFEADPVAFAPQFAGYCAWAVAEGKIAPGNPRHATVYEGKLYLNFNQDVSDTFNTDVAGFVNRADANWPTLKEQI